MAPPYRTVAITRANIARIIWGFSKIRVHFGIVWDMISGHEGDILIEMFEGALLRVMDKPEFMHCFLCLCVLVNQKCYRI